MLAALLFVVPAASHAAEAIEVQDARLQASPDGWLLSADFAMILPARLEDAVNRGVALQFLVEFELTRPRWYWFDEVAIKSTRTFRLSYNLLTERYRASIDGNLHRNFSRLDDMLALLRRPGRWVIADNNALQRDAVYNVSVQFGLDIGQLPKPIQVSAFSNSEWRLSSGWSQFNYKAESK
jgi:hypothetical protein